MDVDKHDLPKLLATNPEILCAYIENNAHDLQLHLIVQPAHDKSTLLLPRSLTGLKVVRHHSSPFRTLTAPATPYAPANQHQLCQNEPVQSGTQIQLSGAAFVGTAGAPVSWPDNQGARHYGILSNWHVIDAGQAGAGQAIHQPTDKYPSIAYLTASAEPTPTHPNKIDAAVADAFVAGYHTISRSVLGIGPINEPVIDATKDLPVTKSGRTTQVTTANCIATGAAVKVQYGTKTMLFEDQDIFSHPTQPFSGPGDSGSLIVTQREHAAVALLFAGSDKLTIGNPIRHVNSAFNLSFL